MNFSYLTPPSKVKRIKHPKNYIYQQIGGKHRRRIFGKEPYQPFEVENINKLKEYLNKKAPYMNYTDELLLRFNYSGNFLLSQAIDKVRQYGEWHENQLITNLQKAGRQILECGHIYAFGRDLDYCPIIIVRPGLIDLGRYSPEDYLSAISNLLSPIETFMLVGGIIEKWNVIVDFESKKCPLSNAQVLSRCFKKISGAYPYRLKRLLFLNSESRHAELKNQISQFLANDGSQTEVKTVLQLAELQQMIPHDELEKKYGGSQSNVCQFWPIHTTNKYDQSESAEDSEAEYKTVMNDTEYFEKERSSCNCGVDKCLIY